MTRVMAQDLRPLGMAVNAVAPGVIGMKTMAAAGLRSCAYRLMER